MNVTDITPNYTLNQIVNSTDLLRQAGTVDFQSGYTDLAIISDYLIRAARHDDQLRRAMYRLGEKIIAEEDRHYSEMAAEYCDPEAPRYSQAA